MSHSIQSIPRPIIRTNQWFIFLSVVVAWFTSSEWVLLFPLITGLSGLLFKYNPVMKLARHFLKKDHSSYIQEDREQQQFNQLIAVILLISALIGERIGSETLYYLSSGMVAAASFIAIMGFCIGCFVRYQWSRYRYQRIQRNKS
ncbi:DUF4395 domain-containing protein [Pseudalkalibacillus sp. Hm43]|uniref:DUF4395 domain-containing protein n=1 Tax=Pseudalkalibacillus sp. Hm43 TaxID=3450742 RepID=UPI003F43E388